MRMLSSRVAVSALAVATAVLASCNSDDGDDIPNGAGTTGDAGSGANAGTSSGASGGASGAGATTGGGAGSAGAATGGSAGSASGGTSATGGAGGRMGAAGANATGGAVSNAGGAGGGAGTTGSGGMTPGLDACPTPPEETPEAAVIAINTENAVRLAMGVECASIALPLCISAQNHCDYYTQNQGDDMCEAASPHSEVEGCPGYTGEGLGERFMAAGYTLRGGGSECMAFLDDPAAAVMVFIDSVYHRTSMLDPWMRDFGYGGSEDCDTIDFGTGAATPATVTAVYPYADQTGLPTSFDGSREGPEPPEPPTGWPSGYPITVYAKNFTVTSHSITLDGSSEELAHQWLAEDDETLPSYAKCLYTDAPMTAMTTYHVVVSGELDGEPKTFDWKFTTGAATGGPRPRP